MSEEKSHEYLFLFSRDQPDVALAECQALHPHTKSWENTNSYAKACIDERNFSHLAYTKKVFHIFKEGELEEIKDFVKKTQLEIKESVSFASISIDESTDKEKREHNKQGILASEARKILSEFTKKPSIDLNNPRRTFALICEKNNYFIAEEVWVNKEKFSKRRNHLLPAPHPTSLQPKLARALINLANPSKESHLLDPFCGSGGILIEAKLMNLKMDGIDIEDAMIERAKKNLASLGLKANLQVGDATKNLFSVDSIITDLPYGKNSKANNLEELYKAFLVHAKAYTKKIVLACPHSVYVKHIIKESDWKIKKEFSLALHKSLTKEIFVLSLED